MPLGAEALVVSLLLAAPDSPTPEADEAVHGSVSANAWVGSGQSYGLGLTGTYYLRSMSPQPDGLSSNELDLLYHRDAVSLSVSTAEVEGLSQIWSGSLSAIVHPWAHTGLTASAGVAEGPDIGDVLGHFSLGVRQYLSPELRLGFGYSGSHLLEGSTVVPNGEVLFSTWQSNGGYVDLTWLLDHGRLAMTFALSAAAKDETSPTSGISRGWGATASAAATWHFTHALAGDVTLSMREDWLRDGQGEPVHFADPYGSMGLRYEFGGGFQVHGSVGAGIPTALGFLALPSGVTLGLGATQRF
jgi:hypothetical protein